MLNAMKARLAALWALVRARLVDDCRRFWKLASVQLAAAVGLLAALIVANQNLALALLGALPAGAMRTVAAVGIGIVVFAVPTLARLWKQNGQ